MSAIMQALPPPIPIYCVKAQEAAQANIRTFLEVTGDPLQLSEWLRETGHDARWKVEADTQSNGIRIVRLSADETIPYKVIGSVIYAAQIRQLSIKFQLVPPICEVEER